MRRRRCALIASLGELEDPLSLDLIKYNYLAQRDLIKPLEDQTTKKDKELEAKESEIESLVEHISTLKDHLSLVEGVAPAEVLRYD